MMPRLSLAYFGTFQAILDGERLTGFHSVKVQALLAYLALEADRPQPREALATLLWPLDSETSARNSLRQALYELRKLLGDRDDSPTPFLLVTRQTVQFNRASDHTIDVADFLMYLKDGRLAEAATCYRGELLSGLSCESEPFEEWLRQTRTHLHSLTVDLFFRLAEQKLSTGDFSQARTYAERQLALEPWREEAHRHLMTALALGGERSAALAQYESCRRVLAAELGVEPEAETMSLYEQIKVGKLRGVAIPRSPTLSGAPAAALPLSPVASELHNCVAVETKVSETPRHNLPTQLTAFVGRKTDLETITARLQDPTCRLLTIVGPGGMGKTRLALQAAQTILAVETTPDDPPQFQDGIFLVTLAGVGSSDLLISTIATTLDFTFYDSGAPKTQLLGYLKSRALLLVLDNFEHLLDGADLVTELLRSAPGVKVLTTSREPLNLHEEWLHPLTGMSFPGDEGEVSCGPNQTLTDYTAVRLFIQCAQRMKPAFALTSEGAAVVRICRLVGGMPLGIEMASSWLKHFTCEQIATEIERNLDFLATTLRNVPARHRSIRAVFDHSWNLLSTAERQVLQRLATFRGGFRLEAAQQVAGASFPLLVALAEKSLVQPTPSGRYQMHELLRQFAEEKLQTLPDEWAAVQERHSHYYLLFLQQHEAGLEGRQMAETVTLIEEEIENIRLAWQWALRHKNVAEIELCLDGLFLFFWLRRWYQEGEAVFAQTLSALAMKRPVGRQGILLGRCLVMEGYLLHLLHIEIGQAPGWAQVESLYQQSLATLHELNASAETGLPLLSLGNYYREVGQLALALDMLEQALDVLTPQGNRLWLRRILYDLGMTHFSLGDYATSLDYFQRCVMFCEAHGDLKTLGDALNMLGQLYRAQGNYSAARQATQAAFAARTTVEDKRGIAWSLQLLGEIAWHTEDYPTAQQHSHESLALLIDMGLTREGNIALNTLGNIALSLGDYAEARRCFSTILAPQVKTGQLNLAWSEIVTLTGLGAVLWKEGRSHQAVTLLTHVLRQPTGWQETKDQAAALLAEFSTLLSPEQFTIAQQRAETQDLATLLAELLAEESVSRTVL